MTPEQKATARAAVIARAVSYLGTQEIGTSNAGPVVNKFLAATNCAPGNSWCMAFVYAMFAWSGYAVVNCVSILIPTPSCAAQAEHARHIGTLVSADDARATLTPGWVMLMWEPDLNRYAHCGIVTDYDMAAGVFRTIEGNTNESGRRQGYEVARQTRGIRDTAGGHAKYAFIRTA